MALKNIIGQQRAVGMLQGILKRDRLGSAYIFCGESGIGKKTAALNFAKAVNCLDSHTTPPVDACEACPSCLKINAGTHPDLIVIAPEDRIIKIEEVRSIEEALSFRPFEGRKKIVIVDDADTMNAAAANAFLKTLEEPPEDSLIMLVTSRPDRLPATIRSRCARIAFQTHSLSSCRAILNTAMAGDEAARTLRLSHGRPGLALAADLREERDWFLGLLEAMSLAEKDGWASREEMERWFDLSLTFVRDLAVYRITGRPSRLVNDDLAETFGQMGQSLDAQGIIELFKQLSFIKNMLLFNLNKSLTWNYTASLLRKELY